MDRIEVTAQFDTQGRITPLSFFWKQRLYRVEDVGRRWEAKDGRHILIMIAGNRVFHLIFNSNSCTWDLVHSDEKPIISQL
jgi:hypothetical protein